MNASASGEAAARVGLRLVVVSVWLTDESLVIEVWDSSPEPPVMQEPDLNGEDGRGLVVVQYVSRQWDHYAADGGKVVWCALPRVM